MFHDLVKLGGVESLVYSSSSAAGDDQEAMRWDRAFEGRCVFEG